MLKTTATAYEGIQKERKLESLFETFSDSISVSSITRKYDCRTVWKISSWSCWRFFTYLLQLFILLKNRITSILSD